jgi:hypothetical protein
MCWGCPGTSKIRDTDDPRPHMSPGCTCKWVFVPANDILRFSYWAIDHDEDDDCLLCFSTATKPIKLR